MLQIKTVIDNSASKFDEEVNAALADGWTLTRRLAGQDAFVAELEKEIITEAEKETITEAEKCCGNCRHLTRSGDLEPCVSCPNGEKWEAAE